MKNIIYSLFLTFSLIIYSNPVPIPIDIVVNTIAVPETTSATITIDEGSQTSINLNDYTTGNPDSFTIVSQPVQKAAQNGFQDYGNGSFVYTHNGSEAPSDSFTFTATNGDGTSNTSTITIKVNNVNDAPTIAAISKTVDEGSSVEIIAIGKDAENSELVYTFTNPSYGTVKKDATTGIFTYTNDGSDNSSDSFTITATEVATTNTTGNLLSGSATVSITVTAVNDAPVATASTITVDEGQSISDVFAATDSDSNNLTSSVTSKPDHGTVTLTNDNPLNYTYTSDGSEVTSDKFTFNISDGALSTSSTVSVNINPTNDAPTANADTYFISGEYVVTKKGVGLLRNDVDPEDNDMLVSLVSQPTSGTLVLNDDGTFSYTPDPTTVFQTDSFTYVATDILGAQSAAATVTFTAATLIPVPDTYLLSEAQNLQVSAADGLLANDVDTNTNFTIDSVWVDTNPKYGTLSLTWNDGSFAYQHDGSENRVDSFEYKVKNSNGDISEKTFVSLFAENVNDAPTSSGTAVTLNEGTDSTFNLSYIDTDSNIDSIVFTLISQPSNGSVVDNGLGSLTYYHNGGETTSDTFNYTVGDGEFTSSEVAVSITVTPVNDLPTASNLSLTVAEGGTISSISVVGTDIETDDNKLTFKLETAPANGTVTISDAGVWSYTHAGTETSSDSFTYSANDGTANGNPATVNITVTAVNSSPVTTAVAIGLNEGANATYDLSTNTSDSDTSSGITYIVVSVPSNGALTDPANSNAAVSAGGTLSGSSVTYTHNGGETNSDSFTFKANDANSDSNVSTATVTVTPINDAPTINSSTTINVDEKDKVDITILGSDAENSNLTYSLVSAASSGTLTDSAGSILSSGSSIPSGLLTYTHTADISSNATDSFQVKANDGTVDSATATINIAVTDINENLPQIIIETSASTVSENGGTVTLTASLVSNDFYSSRRDMDAAPVAANATNSLGYIYLGAYNGHKYYLWDRYKSGGNSVINSTAKSDAAAKGGYLVVFETAAEEAWVKDKLSSSNANSSQNFWIGLNYKLTGDAWKWINGATYNVQSGYTNWNSTPSQSSAQTDKGVYTSRNGDWVNYAENSTQNAYIIEFDNSVNASAATPITLGISGSAQNTNGDSTNDSGDDWTINTTDLSIANGASSSSATITIINDTVNEGNEAAIFTVSTGNASVAGVKGSLKTATLTIQDDEPAVATMTTSANKVTYVEGTDSSINIVATLDNAKAFDSSIGLTLSGTATSGVDYTSSDDGYVSTQNLTGITEAGGLVVDSNGNYFASSTSCCSDVYIKKMTPGGTITNIGKGNWNEFETSPALSQNASLRRVRDMDIDSRGGNNYIFFTNDYSVRIVDASNNRVYYVAGNNDWVNENNVVPSGSNAAVIATSAKFNEINAIAVSANGKEIYIAHRNRISKIYSNDADDLFTNSSLEDWNNIKVVNVANVNNNWERNEGNAASAGFYEPQAMDFDSNGDLIIADYQYIKKLTVGTQASDPQVTNILEPGWGQKRGLVVDSSDNIYFSMTEENSLYKYVASTGSLTKLIESETGGDEDGDINTASISSPRDITLHPSTGNLVFVQEDDKKIRSIDFSPKIRISAGQTTGTYSLTIKDESFYEDNETIKIAAAGSNLSINTSNIIDSSFITFDGGTTNGLIIDSEDAAPSVQIIASEANIAENGGVSTVSFTIGGASESGTKMDLDDGLKEDFPYIGTYQDHKYYIAHEWLSWSEAKDRAEALGGYLLTINSEAENTWLKDNLGDNYKWDSYWLGFSDTAEEGSFVWANGSNSTYTNWNSGEPNNAGDEDVVEFNGYNGKWNDLSSYDGRFFIIEFSGTVSAKPVVIPYVVTRSDGFDSTSGTDATFTDSGNVTIPAGQSKVDLTVTAVQDTANEITETITYTITDAITDGTYDASNSVASVSIIDDEAPAVTWASSASEFSENGGSVTVTATISDNKIKTTPSKLNLTITDNGATLGEDYSISELQKVSTLAGSGSGFKDGTGSDAKFWDPSKITSDSSGNIYVADSENKVIRKITPGGVVTTFAGNGDYDYERSQGNKMDVGFARPSALAFNGNDLYVIEEDMRRISKIDGSSGSVSLVSGGGQNWGYNDGDKNTSTYQYPSALAFDRAGNMYITDDQMVRKLTVDGSGNWSVAAFAGTGSYGVEDGTGTNAEFRRLTDLVIDKSGSEDVMYVADENRIRKITIPGGEVTTYANTDDNWGDGDGTLQSASFRYIMALSIDTSESSLTMYASDEGKIRRITSEGVETLTGNGYGFEDGLFAAAKFKNPRGLAVNSNGIYISDTENNKIRKIDLLPSITIPAGSATGSITINGIDDQLYESATEAFKISVSSVSNVDAGNSTYADISTVVTSDDAAPTIKLTANNDYVDEGGGTASLTVSLADAFSSNKSDMSASNKADFYYLGEYQGSKYYASKDDDTGRKSYSDALADATALGGQLAVVTSAGENDFITNGIYQEDPAYNTDNREWLQHWIGHTYDVGNSVWEWTNNQQSDYTNWGWEYSPDYIDRYYTQIRYRGMWFNGESNWDSQYVIEFSSAISDIDATATITFTGTGATDGTDYTTSIGLPDTGRTVTISKGQPSSLITITGVEDSTDEAIETIIATMSAPSNSLIGTDSDSNPVANTATLQISDNELPEVTFSLADTAINEVAEGGVPSSTTLTASIVNAKLNAVDLSLDFTSSGAGIAVFGNDFGSKDLNRVSTLAGDGNDGYLDGDADEAEFSDDMRNAAVDVAGNVYLADRHNHVIRKITPSGEVSTFAGNGQWWNDGDQDQTDGNKLERSLRDPHSVKFDNNGDMFITEPDAHRISKINMSTGVLSRYIGLTDDQGDDNGDQTQARFNRPRDIAFDSSNNMYVMDTDNTKIRKVDTNRIVTDYAGNGNWGDQDGNALEATLGAMKGSLVIDSSDNLFFITHDRIRKVSADGSTVSTVAGDWGGYSDGFGRNARFNGPNGLAIDGDDNIYVADSHNHMIRKISDINGSVKVTTISGTGDYDFQDGTQDEAAYRHPRFVAYGAGALFVIDSDDNRIRKVQLTPKMTIPAGQNSVTYNISSINDVVYETDESIKFTSSSITNGTYTGGEQTLTLVSDELTPKIQLDAESLVLDEDNGTVTLEVSLTDAAGAASNWEETELPSDASSDFEFMGDFEGHKYYFSRYSQSWVNANQNALELGGQLLVIDSEEENEFVNSIMIHNGTWLGTKRANGDAAWTNVYGSLDFENFADDINTNGYGYAITWGNEWYDTQNDNEYRHYIIEYGPVTTSELASTVDLVIADASTATKGDAEDGTSDYKTSANSFSIPAGAQTATITLTGLQDDIEEPIENILLSIANPGNVDLGDDTSLEIKISDDEAPVVTFTASEESISENGGSVIITANLSNPKLTPTTVSLGLEGTSTSLIDYTVSSIFGYETLAGKNDEPGSSNGNGSNARFYEPSDVVKYLDGSILVSQIETHVIRKIDKFGNVTNFLGVPNSCGDYDGGPASTSRICNPNQLAVDYSTGNVFFGRDSRIYVYDVAADEIIKIYDNSENISNVSGIALMDSNTLLISDISNHHISKLTFDGTQFNYELVAGQKGSNTWWGPWQEADKTIPFTGEPAFTYPGKLVYDATKNIAYLNFYDWAYGNRNWDYAASLLKLDFNTQQITQLHNISQYLYALNDNNWATLRKPSLDSSGNLYIPVNNMDIIAKVSFNADGSSYVSHIIENDEIFEPNSVAISGASAYVSNGEGHTIGKIGLGASIEIPAMQTTNNLTLGAFKDPWFEDDETIDVKVAGLENASAASDDVAVVTIVESTRLTLVADAPFEGVENGKVSWGDYDKDGDMDLALMGSASTGTITNVYKNNNGVFENTNQNFTKFIGGDIEFVDVNQDGWLDVAISGFAEGNIRKSELYINQEGAFFELMEDYQVRGLSQVDMEWGDLDNDGDPDLIIAGIDENNEFMTLYYTNLGDFNFLQEGLFYDWGVINGEIDIVDADQDGDNDLFTNGTAGSVTNPQSHSNYITNTYYREGYDEEGENNDNSRGFNVSYGYKNGNTIYADLDGDGELDFLAMGENYQGNIEKVSNLAALNNLPDLKNVDFDFADYNNDGQSDLIIAGEDVSSGAAVTKLYVTFPDYFGGGYGLIDSGLSIAGLRSSSTYWIDYDKDGDLDLFLTGLDDQGIAKSMLYKAENTNNLNTAPAKITNLTATDNGYGSVEFKWNVPTDNISSSFRYDIRIGTTSGASDIAYANSNIETGSTLINIPSLSTLNNKEVILNPGTYFASVQAIDGGNMGGTFSDEVTFTLDYEWKQLNLGGIIDRRLLPTKSTQLEFLDMDGDGDKDLISTNLGMRPMGSANQNQSENQVNQRAINIYAFDNEVFKPVMDRWGGESNYEFGDFNNDGEKDIILAIEEDSGTRLRVLLNTRLKDDAREDDTTTPDRNEGLERDFFEQYDPFDGNNFLTSVYNIEFAIKDLDNDGLVEVIAAGQSSKLTNEATTVMAMVSTKKANEDQELGFNNFKFSEPVSVVDADKLSNLSFAAYDFGDIDNDGDFDFLISGYSFDGYKTILFENKRRVDADGVTVQPIEVYFEEKDQSFVSVKSGTADFVDFDADGKLDVLFSGQSSNGDLVKAYKNGKDTDGDGQVDEDGYFDLDVGLPAVREGRFVFGDFDSNGYSDVVYSGTVAGQGKITKMATWVTETSEMVDSGYDLSYYQDANIGVGDFDGDMDADLLITGKNKFVNDINSPFQYISDVFINVRGFAGPDDNSGGISDSGSGYREGTPLKKSIGVKKTYGLNARPFPPTEVNFQRSRLGAVRPNEDGNGNKTSSRNGATDDSNEALFEMVISWSGAVDTDADGKKTPAEGLTYSVRIGTTPGGEEILASGSDIDGVKVAADKGNAENNLSWKVNVPQGDYYVSVQSIDASFIGSTFSPEQKYTVTSAFKLGDSNGDDGVNILDLTTNLDYILGNNPKVFVQEVADVNNDGKIDVTDISAIVNLILNGEGGVANGSNYDPYDWDYFSDVPVGDATLVHTDNRVYLENDKPVTSLQFSMDATVDYELSEALDNMSVVTYVEDGKRTFLIYSYNNQPINELTNVVFDYIDVNENEEFEIGDLSAGTNDGLVLDLKYSDERFFDSMDESIKMYPNPVISNLNLLTDLTKNVERLDVNIYNVLGVSVYNTTIDSMGRLNDLDVSMLSSGLYTVQVRMVTTESEEIVSVHKLIKK